MSVVGVKLKREKPGVYRIGLTNWYLLKVYNDGKPTNLWDLGFDDGRNMNVAQMFGSRDEALTYFKRHLIGKAGW